MLIQALVHRLKKGNKQGTTNTKKSMHVCIYIQKMKQRTT